MRIFETDAPEPPEPVVHRATVPPMVIERVPVVRLQIIIMAE